MVVYSCTAVIAVRVLRGAIAVVYCQALTAQIGSKGLEYA